MQPFPTEAAHLLFISSRAHFQGCMYKDLCNRRHISAQTAILWSDMTVLCRQQWDMCGEAADRRCHRIEKLRMWRHCRRRNRPDDFCSGPACQHVEHQQPALRLCLSRRQPSGGPLQAPLHTQSAPLRCVASWGQGALHVPEVAGSAHCPNYRFENKPQSRACFSRLHLRAL